LNASRRRRFASLALLIAAIIWGGSFPLLKDAVDAANPFTVVAVRFTIAALVLAAGCIPRLKRATRAGVLRGAVIGAMLIVPQCLQTIGIADTTPGKNAFLTTIYVVGVPFVYWLIDRSRPDRYNIIAALLLIAGVGLVSLTEAFTISWGDSLTLLSGVFFSAHIVAIAKLGRDQDPFVLTISQFVTCAVFGWVFALVSGGLREGFAPVIEAGWPILYLALLCTALGLLMQMIGQKYTHPSSASIIMGLEAVFGALFSALFGYEVLTLRMLLGFAVIFAAVLISELKPWKRREAAEAGCELGPQR